MNLDFNGTTSSENSASFKIFSGSLTASRDGAGLLSLSGVASSTTRDLHGDTMQASALEDMERAANQNLTIFLNHSYAVPEDVAGSVQKARMVPRGVDQDGNPNYDLDFTIALNSENPRAVAAYKAIESGTKLGLSIGANIPKGGATRTKENTWIIEHVELMETSIVGIPANPRSWIQNAVKALTASSTSSSSTTIPIGQPSLTLDGNQYTITGTLDTGDVTFTPIENAACPECGGGKNKPKPGCDGDYHDKYSSSYFESLPDEAFVSVTLDATVLGDPTNSYIQPTRDYPHHDADGNVDVDLLLGYLSEEAPDNEHLLAHALDEGLAQEKDGEIVVDVTDASVTIIQIDTDDSDNSSSESESSDSSSQGASSSEPDTDGEVLAADVELTASASATFAEAMETLRVTTKELLSAREEIDRLVIERDAALTARRETEKRDEQLLKEMTALIDKVANAPLVRRAVAIEARREFEESLSAIYGEDVLKMMRS